MRLTSIVLSMALAANVASAQVRHFDLKTTASLGRKLYERSNVSPNSLSPESAAAIETAAKALPQIDLSKYRFEVLEDPAGDAFLVYALAYSKNPDDVVLGIHYRVSVTHDAKKVKSVEPLSRSALIVKKSAGVPPGAAPVGVWGINLVSPTPLETHVYLSLLHHTPIFLRMADHSIWKVDGQQIAKVRNAQ